MPLQPWYVQSERPPPYATVALAPPAHTPFTNTNPSRQPLRLEVKKKLTARSDRIKSVDLHPVEVSGATEAGWYTCVCEQLGRGIGAAEGASVDRLELGQRIDCVGW